MAPHWVVFAAALCFLGGRYAAPCDPCDPVPVIIEEPCGEVVVAPCDTETPIPLPTPLSFPIPMPPPLPSSSIYSILSHAQNGDPNTVLSVMSKLLASTLPCPHLQAAASAQPPPETPCDDQVEPPCNLPVPVTPHLVSSNILPPPLYQTFPAPLPYLPAPVPIAPPCSIPAPVPIAPPCNIPTPIPAAPPCNSPAPIAPPCNSPASVASPCNSPAPVPIASPCNVLTPTPAVPPSKIAPPVPVTLPCNNPVPVSVAPPAMTVPKSPAPVLQPSDKPIVVGATVKNPTAPIVPTPTIQTPVSYTIGPPPPTDTVVPACGQDGITLAALQQQANLGLTVPAQALAQLEPEVVPARVAPCTSGPSVFEFPQFGHATNRLYQHWGRMYDPMRRLYKPMW